MRTPMKFILRSAENGHMFGVVRANTLAAAKAQYYSGKSGIVLLDERIVPLRWERSYWY